MHNVIRSVDDIVQLRAQDGPDLMADEHVILLHGIWMRGLTLSLLKKRLKAAGFGVELFDYASLLGSQASSCARLVARMHRASSARVHLVGHSLGGLIALQATRGRRDLPPGNIVCLGSPLNGSAAARGLARSPAGRLILGRSLALLQHGVERWDGSRPVGVIAGHRSVGVGRLLGRLAEPNDGTVSVEETRLAGIVEHRAFAVTHTGLPLSVAVADATITFLQKTSFL